MRTGVLVSEVSLAVCAAVAALILAVRSASNFGKSIAEFHGRSPRAPFMTSPPPGLPDTGPSSVKLSSGLEIPHPSPTAAAKAAVADALRRTPALSPSHRHTIYHRTFEQIQLANLTEDERPRRAQNAASAKKYRARKDDEPIEYVAETSDSELGPTPPRMIHKTPKPATGHGRGALHGKKTTELDGSDDEIATYKPPATKVDYGKLIEDNPILQEAIAKILAAQSATPSKGDAPPASSGRKKLKRQRVASSTDSWDS